MYFTYGKSLQNKVVKADPNRPTPAHRLYDGVDYVPAHPLVLYGHHFASIAGAGPIVGPAIAMAWGWLPGLIWVWFGNVFIGAVHDYLALMSSVRYDGKSVQWIAGRLMSRRTGIAFELYIWFALLLVVAAFTSVIAGIFNKTPEAATAALLFLVSAVIVGYLMYKTDLHFFAEIRAPKSSKECKIYRHGGLRSIQVGIEALSDSLLQRMCKGTTVIENIAAMKFAAAAGIQLDGNLILEFPGSTGLEVKETLAVLEAVLPYRPLQGAGFFLGQGSPVSRHPRQFGIRATTHHPNNRLLFPKEILLKLDLLIKGFRGDRSVQKKRWQPVRLKIAAWQAFHQKRACTDRPALSLRDGGTFLILRQERPDLPTLHHRLKGLSRKIYLACEEPVTRKELLERFKTIKEEQLTAFLDGLSRDHLIYCDATRCLALAIREKE